MANPQDEREQDNEPDGMCVGALVEEGELLFGQ